MVNSTVDNSTLPSYYQKEEPTHFNASEIEVDALEKHRVQKRRLMAALAVTGIVAVGGVVGVAVLAAKSSGTENNPAENSGVRSIQPAGDLEQYIPGCYRHSMERIQDAINPAGSIPGSLQAALSGTCPNYAFTWTRDQALVYQVPLREYERSEDAAYRAKFERNLKDFASHAHEIYIKNRGKQDAEGNYWTLADAKYHNDGNLYRGGWCDPQTDGPAMRVTVLMRFADRYMEIYGGDKDNYIQNNVFSSTYNDDTKNPVVRDLYFLADNWNLWGCEPWEEVRGLHFYNKLMARRAFKTAIDLINKYPSMFPTDLKGKLEAQVGPITNEIGQHWRSDLGTIQPTKDNNNRLDDIQTVLATFHSYAEIDNYFGPLWNEVMANVVYSMKSFENIYNINKMTWNNVPELGVACGRYYGDVYSGYNPNEGCPVNSNICPTPCLGQPWFLATHGVAELLYRIVAEADKFGEIEANSINKVFFEYFGSRGVIEGKTLPVKFSKGSSEYNQIMTGIIHAADAQLKRSAYHAGQNFKMDEQFNADTGMMMSAGDLTWSYASFVTAVNARDAINVPEVLETYTPTDSVEIEIIVQGVAEFTPGVYITGNTASLGNWTPCSGTPAWYRRNVRGSTEWSTFIRVPKNQSVELKAVRVNLDGGCSVQNWSGAENTKINAGDKNPKNAVYVLF